MEECPRCRKSYKNLKLHAKSHQTEDMLQMMTNMGAEMLAMKAALNVQAAQAPAPAPPPPPPPPSYAAVAALPPTQPEQLPMPTQRIFPTSEPVMTSEYFNKIMRMTTDNDAWLPLRLAYSSHPEDFTLLGDKHTDITGNNMHISVEWHTGLNKIGRQTYRTLHIYGADRFGRFRPSYVTLMAYKDKLIHLGNFIYYPPKELKISDDNTSGSN